MQGQEQGSELTNRKRARFTIEKELGREVERDAMKLRI